jgi:two-component system phosphate regulon sensor histidine kinase PhoR
VTGILFPTMLSSRLFWKLMLACAGLNVAAAVAIAFLLSRGSMGGAIALVCAVVLGFSWWIASHISRPVTSLTEAAEHLASGEYGHRVYVANRDEFGTLARTINRLSQELDARMKQLGQTGDRQSTVLGGMIEGVIAVDARQRIVLANPAAGRLFEFRPVAVEGRPLLEVVRNHAVHEAVTAALATGQPQRIEAKSTVARGSPPVVRGSPPVVRGSPDPAAAAATAVGRPATTVHVDIHVQPLPGRPCPGVVLVMHDTTELRRLESLRRDFLANVSHELKTPLSSIKAYSETLRNGALHDPENCHKFLARIEEQTDRLHHLIIDMLMLARIESDQQAFDIVAVDVPQVVAGCLDDHRRAAEAKGIRLAVEPGQAPPDGRPPCRVQADREGLREILDNLIDNAVKYTPEGGQVTVSWSEERGMRSEERGASLQSPAPSPQSPTIHIVVRDTGIGIRPEDQRRVFERFYRVDKARSRELGGTGLGLAIVKHLVQSFGGNVAVASEPGKGSTFTVELPAA